MYSPLSARLAQDNSEGEPAESDPRLATIPLWVAMGVLATMKSDGSVVASRRLDPTGENGGVQEVAQTKADLPIATASNGTDSQADIFDGAHTIASQIGDGASPHTHTTSSIGARGLSQWLNPVPLVVFN
ncbi:hypothetical protein F0562_003369 [Nyssa sinensis]|uniref:Uncharacterized protein n=1 Tax=Nyssa sinensis TaxID=561372 RepID=A0A5J5BYB7_9ASTE|nr:hypothetical protein F0562_003369 [Nyssa sinensis]